MYAFAFLVRDALRSVSRDRAYAATVLLTLGLTIGGTTAVFSIVDGILLEPLAYQESHQLVMLREVWRELGDRASAFETNERHFNYWREHARSFEAMAQYRLQSANLTGVGDAVEITVAHASGSLFDVLRLPAAVGRMLTVADEPVGSGTIAVIADSLWRQRFGADRRVVGRAMTIDGVPHTIVGVLPAGFRLPVRDQLTARVDAFVPLRVDVGWVGDHNDQAIGRLRRGVSTDQARAELDVLQRQVSAIATQEAHEPVTLASVVVPLTDAIVGRARRGLVLLLGAIASVLLIACSNLANLSLTRALTRARDVAIRTALGADRARLVARALLEQVLLAGGGGALGLAVAWAALRVFVRTAPLDLPRVEDVALNGRVLIFAAVTSVAAGLIVAIAPAWWIAGRDAQEVLRGGGRAGTADRGGLRTRAALLGVQVALSVLLLAVTGLFGVSFMRLLRVDRGFDADRVLTLTLSMPENRYSSESVRQAAYERLMAAVRSLPGVASVTTASMLPMTGYGQVNSIQPERSGWSKAERPTANFRFVAPDYFRTLGIKLTRGRPFADADHARTDATAVVISEPTAARLWPGQDPVGRRFSRGLEGEAGFEVVGVAVDARLTSLEQTPPLMVYVPYWWRSRAAVSLLVKTSGDAALALPAIRRAIAGVDADIAIGKTQPLEQLVDASSSGRRYQAQLLTAFAATALLIAMIGVYGVTAYGVARRRREMNIRTALGAQRSQVLRLVLAQGGVPIVAGALAGAAAAVAAGGVLAGLLFEVQARNPWIISAVAALVAGVGLLSAAAAARQGLTLNPAAALRDE